MLNTDFEYPLSHHGWFYVDREVAPKSITLHTHLQDIEKGIAHVVVQSPGTMSFRWGFQEALR